MQYSLNSKAIGVAMFFIATLTVCVYFAFAAIQGDFGIFKRMEIEAQERELRAELQTLQDQHAVLANRTRRLSDHYLDLDLLDEQARKVLGMARGSEIIIR